MHADELKQELRRIFGEQIKFNREFSKYAKTIKNIDKNLTEWCLRIIKGELIPKYSKKRKECVVFIKKIGSSNRCIVIKMVNGEFKEVHLGDHAYYNKLRKILGLKQDSKEY